MKKNHTLCKLFSLALIVSTVGLFTACGCGRSVEPDNNSTNTTSESGTNTVESDRFNNTMDNTNTLGTTDGMVDSTTDNTNNGIVGGVVDDIVGGVDDMMNTTESGLHNQNTTETGINNQATTESTAHDSTVSRMR